MGDVHAISPRWSPGLAHLFSSNSETTFVGCRCDVFYTGAKGVSSFPRLLHRPVPSNSDLLAHDGQSKLRGKFTPRTFFPSGPGPCLVEGTIFRGLLQASFQQTF